MLQITVPATEFWDEQNERFVERKERTLQLEHSLVSLSKWESKWNKAFLSDKPKSHEEVIDYIKCMTITQNVDPDIYNCLTAENVKEIDDYISAPMTATVFSEDNSSRRNREVVTAEIIYYWMIKAGIPVKFEKWHLNRLITLIRVCSIKEAPPKKRSKRDILSQNAAINAARRKQLNTRG